MLSCKTGLHIISAINGVAFSYQHVCNIMVKKSFSNQQVEQHFYKIMAKLRFAKLFTTAVAPPPGVVFSVSPPALSSPHFPIASLSWSQWARSCSRSRSTLASLRPRLSSGWEWTMLCRAAAALALAALLPRVLPSNPGSLSLPWRSCISSGRQPGGKKS